MTQKISFTPPLHTQPSVERLPSSRLDSIARFHLSILIQQSLFQTLLPNDPWEDIFCRIADEIFDNFSQAISVLDSEPRDYLLNYEIVDGNPLSTEFIHGKFQGCSILDSCTDSLADNALGGSVFLCINEKNQKERVIKVLQLVAYTVCNAVLEAQLFKDLRVPMLPAKNEQPSSELVFRERLFAPKNRKGRLWLWLMGRHHHTHPKARLPRRPGLDALISPQLSPSRLTKRGLSVDGNAQRSIAQITGRLSRPRTSSTMPPINRSVDDIGLYSYNRFNRMVKQMEGVVLSVSPAVTYPPPHLLEQLSKEEEEEMEKEMATKLASLSVEKVDNFYTSANTSAWSCKTVASHIKVGMSYLSTNNNTVNGVFLHQSLCFNQTLNNDTIKRCCEFAESRFIEFYRQEGENADETIAEFVYRLCDDADKLCYFCRQTLMDHEIVYSHGKGEISIKVLTNDDHYNKESAIVSTTRCRQCQASTRPVTLSRASERYSFGKLLEHWFYNANLFPPFLCTHADSGQKDAIGREFKMQAKTVQMTYRSIELFQVHLPPLQIDSSLALIADLPHSMSNDSYENVLDNASLEIPTDAQNRWVTTLKSEITDFYKSVYNIITLLELSCNKKAMSSSATLEFEVALSLLHEMQAKSQNNEYKLLDMLVSTDPKQINQVRRVFIDIIKDTKLEIELWGKMNIGKHVQQMLEDIKEPEWSGSRVFPEGWVIVRDSEICSIMAFSLWYMPKHCIRMF